MLYLRSIFAASHWLSANNPANHPHRCHATLREISLLLPTGKPGSQLVGSLTHSLHHMPYSAPVCVQCNMGREGGRRETMSERKERKVCQQII